MDIRNEADMAIGDTQQILQAATAWMGSFIATDQRKDKIIQELLRRLEDTEETMDQLRGDLAAERKSRRDYQMESDKSSQDMKRLEQKIKDGSFIAILIDGDGAKFADQYIRNPLEGGPAAAQALKQAVRDYLQTDNHDFNTEDIPIVARAYANLNDLAKSLRLSNVIDRDEDMRTFAEQFTNSRAEVDFVNVGRGKENADSKLRKMLNHYLRNLQCKKIFVACCHDNGYLHHTPFTDSTASTPATMHADTEPQLAQLTRTASVLSSGNGGVSISYAKAGGSESLQNIDIAAKPKKMTKTMLFNSDGHRIDPPTKHPANTPAQQTYQSKLEKVNPNAFCNDHYLVGKCKRPNCERIHDVDLSPQEVAIHRYKARTSVCPRGPIECFDYDCYLSHHCLKDPRCTRGPGCKFTNTEWGNLHLDTNEKLTPSLRWTDGVDFPDRLN
ncbi:hypothetical protein PG997_008845 [Apiospora hydei]|uniref:C3H1-type domain-containing protein n=1 Tax=Apiospora hydei TaxID=1337664 RepID=A0ABR1WC70_9PEZI